MKKCIVISDSFKGTLSSREICAIARDSLSRVFPDCEAVCIPVADGGEGTVDCFEAACGGQRVTVPVRGPLGEIVPAEYLRLSGGRAVIEMAAAAGLPLVGTHPDPCRASSFGVGELIAHAAEHGCRDILLGLGGSATNDGGCGCAAALGVRFLDSDDRDFVPAGGTLSRIRRIDPSPARQRLEGVHLAAMCDIDNPLFGPEGAAFVFAPQKGADAETVRFLDGQLRALDGAIWDSLGLTTALLPGAGAAGGFGAGAAALLGAELKPGMEAVLDLVDFDSLLDGCDVVFTGEGRLDGQSLRGKVVSGVARRARRKSVPVVVLAGGVTEEAEELCARPDTGIAAIFSACRLPLSMEEVRPRSGAFYAHTFENILRVMAQAERMGS